MRLLLAHASNVQYDFPIPIWVYAAAAAVAVLASGPAAAYALRAGREHVSGDLYPLVRRLRLSAIATAVAGLILVDVVVGGLFGDPISFTANPAPVVVWVVFWVGLGLVSGLVGNLFDFLSPLSAAGRALDRRLALRGKAARAYPAWLGVWPAAVLLVWWSWAELIWERGDTGHVVAWLAISYFVWQLLGMAVFGAEVWLARCELFTVLARTFARFAPLEFFVRQAAGPCEALRCDEHDGERRNCPACWRAAAPEDRGLRLRAYGTGIRREPLLGPGGGALVVLMLATVVYDGWRASVVYSRVVSWAWPNGSPFGETVGISTLLVGLGLFTLAFVAACALVSLREAGGVVAVAARYAPTLVPIAAVYFASHYFLYWLYVGQLAPRALADPFARGWVPDYRPWEPLPGWAVWWIEVALIVAGHVVAVVEAHRIAARHHRSATRALGAQLPLLLLMVAYTFAGLWVLGQQLAPR